MTPTMCPCGEACLPVVADGCTFVCRCGREYGVRVNIQALVRRVDDLARRIGELERERSA